jgi:crotonobetainyl-CoA:carnitine CoA-transferase CaiB-like acyl-CoA transferase
VIPGVQVADLAGGMIAAFAILAALIARQRTGRGQYVDVSMFDVMMSMLPVPAAQFFGGNRIPVGGRYVLSGAYPFYNVYETADGGFMTLGALEPKFWANFCAKVGREDLISRQFDGGERRLELFEELRSLFKSKSRDEWVESMKTADCCCEPVLSLEEAFVHDQARAREMLRDAFGASQLGFSSKFSDTPGGDYRATPDLGEQGKDLLIELGVEEDERKRLLDEGILTVGD